MKKYLTLYFPIAFACFAFLLSCKTLKKNVNFSEEYIEQHKDKFEVDVPEVHELANILVALSNVGQTDSKNKPVSVQEMYNGIFQVFLAYP